METNNKETEMDVCVQLGQILEMLKDLGTLTERLNELEEKIAWTDFCRCRQAVEQNAEQMEKESELESRAIRMIHDVRRDMEQKNRSWQQTLKTAQVLMDFQGKERCDRN